MDMKEMVIEVNGLPDNYSSNEMIDKLTMHFLRPSNKGGEVLIVIYPTSNKGQAYVVFEEEEVPGVLKHNHVLELDSQFYPLDVKKMHQPKLDIPAEAFLNVKMFSSQRKIRDILHSHGFQVSETSSGELHLQGTFLNLKRIHPKLMRLLAQEIHPQRRTPSQYSNGFSSDSVLRASSSDYDHRSYSTSRHSHSNGHSVYAAGRNTSSGINSRSPESPDRQALVQAFSPLDVSSSAESSFSSPTRSSEDSSMSVRQRNLPSPKRKTEDYLHVDPDVFKYVMRFKDSFIEKIESDYHTKIDHEDDSGVVKVKVSGGACEKAAKKISEFMQDMSLSLCTHEIDLTELDSSQKKHIFQKAISFQKIYSVLIRHESDIIKVVGSSKDSYEAKEKLLGREVDHALPGNFTKNIQRRSRSLPRPKTKAREENTDLGQSPDAVYTTTVSSSSASHYRTESQLQQEVQQERGRKPTKSSTPRGRAHRASRLQHKSQSRVNQEASSSHQQDLTPSDEVQTSKQKTPKIRSPLFSGSVDKLIKITKTRFKK
ncbi:uncharacterized protein LOC132104458 [Carassius carassius]|uniref:uncharacterized protein LOC132104458 n=1 Tax=Carassius carassius TaxID=217509 RepID=UPI002868CC5D|nr:uncharacterized protein LOC132104458 [Carassius carassius]